MNKLQNLRNKPFLVVNTIFKPATDTKTQQKGWMNNPKNAAIFERAWIVDRVSNKIMQEATVIIDIVGGTAVKNRFIGTATPKTDDEIIEHYLGKYEDKCKQGIQVWLTKYAKDFSQTKEYLDIKNNVEAQKSI